MTKEQRRKLQRKIEDIEMYNNGFNNLSGTDVKVLNIKMSKEDKRVYYDCILYRDMESGHTERFNDCWISFKTLELT